MFRERGMKTFADWLQFYNNLDVEPFLEAKESTRDFYTGLGILLFKDAVSLQSVSMKYLLWGTLNQRKAPELYARGKEAETLKAAVVGGPNLIFKRNNEAGKTRIRSYKFQG